MTSDERKTLEALIDRADHAGAWGSGSAFDAAAALRAALAEVDRLQAQVADLTETRDYARAKWDGYETERERECVELRAQVADLEARAIPKTWIDAAKASHVLLEISFTAHGKGCSVRSHFGGSRGRDVAPPVWIVWPVVPLRPLNVADTDEPIRHFPTLSAALSAAKEAP